MNVYYSDTFELPLPAGHKFPMSKYRRLRERIELSELAAKCHLRLPPPATDLQLQAAHTAEYVLRAVRGELSDLEMRRIGFPWSEQMIIRSRHSVGASIAAARDALQDGIAVNLAGGTHHAFADAGQGYCVFNDVCVAAKCIQAEQPLQILVIDLDVHQGNGTAAITADDKSIFTVSIHCVQNFPHRKTASDLDVPLPAGTGDDEYLSTLRKTLDQAFEQCQPDLVFYVSGADAFAGDRFGRLKLSKQALAERDQMVFEACAEARAAVAVSMAGGYAPEISDIVDIHFATVAESLRYFDRCQLQSASGIRDSL